MCFVTTVSRVRMQVPVGPQPRSVSAQVIFRVAKYPASNPACAITAYRLHCVVFGAAHPAQPIAGFLHDKVAYPLQQTGFLGRANQGLIAFAEDPLGLIDAPQPRLSPDDVQ